MEDFEVKNAIFKKGLRKALEYEIRQNLQVTEKISERIEMYRNQWSPKYERSPILLIPFYTEAWRSVVGSGILYILKDGAALVEAYSIIHEINYLIDSLRYEQYQNSAYTQVDNAKPNHGTWIPEIIKQKSAEVRIILLEIKFK